MAKPKTTYTDASVEEYINARGNEQQRADCQELIAMYQKIIGEPPRMWGSSIVGFGSYKYKYDSGHSGEAALGAFAIRGRDLVVYVLPETDHQKALLTRLGKHSIGKSCLYFRTLADLDKAVLEELITDSITECRRRYG